MVNSVQEFFGDRVRVRACGILARRNEILLVNHRGLYDHDFWAPPGGGVNFGESTKDALVREFEEETGLIIEAGEHLFTCELIQPPLHAIELFFSVVEKSGVIRAGQDPESPRQIISDVRFVPWKSLENWPREQLHGIFKKVSDPAKILDLRGYFKL